MAHEPKLTVYTIRHTPRRGDVENSNRNVLRLLTNQANDNQVDDKVLFMDFFKAFLHGLDKPEMFEDPASKKCMTANQPDLENEHVEPNIIPTPGQYTISGIVEGGGYGRKRRRIDKGNKADRSDVAEDDAIANDFYFMLYADPAMHKMSLLVQSYTDETIDTVMKTFWQNFLAVDGYFFKPKIERFTPQVIIDKFMEATAVAKLEFTQEFPGETLLDDTLTAKNRSYMVTVQIKPVEGNLTIDEYNETLVSLDKSLFGNLKKLVNFSRKKGTLADLHTGSTTPFDLESDFDIDPVIRLSHLVHFDLSQHGIDVMNDYCWTLLDGIKQELYTDGIQEG